MVLGQGTYHFHQEISGLPPCPQVLDVVFSLDSMRRLTRFVDTLEVLEEAPDAQVLRVTFNVMGFSGDLEYDRRLDRAGGTMTIRLLGFREALPLVPWPTAFVAAYHITSTPGATRVDYTQDATLPGPISLYQQVLLKAQLRRFERTLQDILEETCR